MSMFSASLPQPHILCHDACMVAWHFVLHVAARLICWHMAAHVCINDNCLVIWPGQPLWTPIAIGALASSNRSLACAAPLVAAEPAASAGGRASDGARQHAGPMQQQQQHGQSAVAQHAAPATLLCSAWTAGRCHARRRLSSKRCCNSGSASAAALRDVVNVAGQAHTAPDLDAARRQRKPTQRERACAWQRVHAWHDAHTHTDGTRMGCMQACERMLTRGMHRPATGSDHVWCFEATEFALPSHCTFCLCLQVRDHDRPISNIGKQQAAEIARLLLEVSARAWCRTDRAKGASACGWHSWR